MSSGKLDQSLDDILKTNRQSTSRGRGRAGRRGGRPTRSTASAAPVGGVQKAKQAKGIKAAPAGASSGSGDSKIQVSNLPADVDEQQIKEYFTKSVGFVKKVSLAYGPTGKSRGICTVIFSKPTAAAEAAKSLDGVKVDNRPMRVEVLLSAKDAPAPPPTKSFAERVSQPKQAKAQPKPVTTAKAAGGRGRAGKRGRAGRTNRAPRKTAEELDAEMTDYFQADGTNANGDAMVTNGGAVQNPAAGGDTGMDEML